MAKVQCLQYNRFSDARTGIEFHSILDQKTGLNIGVADVEDEDALKRFKDQPDAFKILSDADFRAITGLSGRHTDTHAHHHTDPSSPTEGAPPDPSSLHEQVQTDEEQGDKPTSRRRKAGQTIEDAAIGAAESQTYSAMAEDNPLEGAPAPPPSE